jgi:hypothetical protein
MTGGNAVTAKRHENRVIFLPARLVFRQSAEIHSLRRESSFRTLMSHQRSNGLFLRFIQLIHRQRLLKGSSRPDFEISKWRVELTRRKDGPGALKARLLDLSDLDQRTNAAKLAQQVKANIIADLGGEEQLSTLERLACEHAALASAVVADSYARWLKGQEIALTELATVQNAFLRVAGSLGFSRRAKDISRDINKYLEGNTDE